MKYLVLLLLCPLNGFAQTDNYYQYIDSITNNEFLRREEIIKKIPNISDTARDELVILEWLEIYGLCHDHYGSDYHCFWNNRDRNDTDFADKVQSLSRK